VSRGATDAENSGVLLSDVRRLRVLHAIHDFLPRHRAGSEIYAAELCRELRARHDVTLLCAEYDPSRTHGHLTWREHDGLPVVEMVNNWVCETFADSYASPVLTARVGQVLDAVEPHIVHAHSFLNLSYELAAEARRRGIPVVATLHDYSLVCPSGGQRLHRAESHVCHTIDVARCVRCFQQSPFYTQMAVGGAARMVAASGLLQRLVGAARQLSPGLVQSAAKAAGQSRRFPVTEADIAARLAHARRLFGQVDLFVAPSPSLGAQFRELGLDPKKITVSDNGFRPAPRAARPPAAGPLRIGFVGTLVWHKGVHVLVEAVRGLPAGSYELALYGDLTTFPEYVTDLRRLADGLPVHFMGGFDSTATTDIYGRFDVLVVPSVWLENSPLVIHEAFQAGVPVVGSRMGGIVDLIRHGEWGLLFDAGSPAALAEALRSILSDRRCLDDWTARLPAVKSIAENAREWEANYERVLAAPSRLPA
jgi:glycosyltransferase involved in cell wall biosynthesis